MSASAREKARENGQKSGKGNRTLSRLLERLGIRDTNAESGSGGDAE